MLKLHYELHKIQVGLAVDDIKDILSTAEVEKLKSKVTGIKQ
jgi:hypothetical protein